MEHSKTDKKSNSLATRIAQRLKKSDSKLLQKISKSLNRDKNYSTTYLAKKGVFFFMNMLASKFILRKCDKVGRGIRVEKKPYLLNQGEMYIGDNVNISSRKVACDLVSYPGGRLEIGDNSFINFGTTLCAKNKVSIGKNVKIGPYCMIHDTDFHIQGEDYKEADGVPIIIEDDVWLSSRVLVMKGTIIGKGSIIAAGSVVSGIIPPNVIAAGVPAKIIKHLDNNLDDSDDNKEPEICPELKNKADKIIANVLGMEISNLDPATNISEIPAWSSENHLLIINSLSELLDKKITLNEIARLKSLQKIYSWAHQPD